MIKIQISKQAQITKFKIQNRVLDFWFWILKLFRVSGFSRPEARDSKVGFRVSSAGRWPGFGLVEVVVGVALITAFLFAVAEVGRFSSRLVDTAGVRLQAAFLLEEGIEAVRGIRDTGWNAEIASLTVNTDYWLIFDGARWTTSSSSPSLIDGRFDRRVRFSQVQRDVNDSIVDSGGTVDDGTRKVTISVSWSERGTTTVNTVSTYITNLFNN